ncbi:MAG: peroxidase-related enzyme [Burkholderiaceae bacterium]
MASSQYPAPEIKDLPSDIQERILQVQEKIGFVPNVFITLAHRPAEWRAFFAYHDALMAPESVRRESGLTKGEREMIVTTTSALNHCLYCVVAHGAILRIYEKNPLLADQVSINYRKANLSDRQKVMLEFAIKVCEKAHEIDDSDFQKLHQVGFNDEDIWDIAAITAFFGMSNRLANFTSMQPNPEFYTMGRVKNKP